MSTGTLTNLARRELAQRVSAGLEITLYWNPLDNSTTIELYHPATEQTITFPIAPERALDAYHHPFAHLSGNHDAFPASPKLEPVGDQAEKQGG